MQLGISRRLKFYLMHLPSINSHQSQILAELLGSDHKLKDEESLKIRSEK